MGGGGRGEGCTGGEGRAMCCMGTSPAGPPALIEASNVDTGQGLCKQSRLKWLSIDTGCFNDSNNPTLYGLSFWFRMKVE